MASKKVRIKLVCPTCKIVNYFTNRTKEVTDVKLELKKFCKKCRKHTVHKEAKK